MSAPAEGVRLDKWLWAARLFKTRSLAAEATAAGRVRVNGIVAKASRELRLGDELALRETGFERVLHVRGLSAVRGPAPVAQTLYEETPQSQQARQRAAEARRLGVEPALAQQQGRPTKRDRRDLAQWQRWSASLDEGR